MREGWYRSWVLGLLLLLAPVAPEAGWAQGTGAVDTLAVEPADRFGGSGYANPLVAAGDDPPFDLAVARRVRAAGVQQSAVVRAVADVVGFAAIPGAPAVAAGLFGIGELNGRGDLRTLGLQTGQAIVLAGGVTLLGKVAMGRQRPHMSPDDPYRVRLGGGLSGDDHQSFPSAHTASAFATAFVLADELSERHPGSGVWVIPAAFTTAGLAGLSRVFQDHHWLSDVVAGAVVGSLSGWVVTELHEN